MTTAGPRPGAWRPARLALLAVALTTGCGSFGTTDTHGGGRAGTGTTPPASATAPTSTTPSASATPPEVLCTRIVTHWSRKVLDGTTYGDYQSMGLSNGQYDILRAVVDAARAEKKRRGADAADQLIDRQARQGCADWYRSGGPGEGAWQ
ncbi:hypothetical protein [Streptomyces sp. A012304]|uniref:hypothetical protein n=1 Tax=Streptomyces sp. A012304 TaxID=375446 RepID=UPI00222F629A|nr:hypothetical protein [Streptomyces sp. A012304]GKQ38156.1 hypothetical protein ALMP_46900 [Streptomyces sp. A012304]